MNRPVDKYRLVYVGPITVTAVAASGTAVLSSVSQGVLDALGKESDWSLVPVATLAVALSTLVGVWVFNLVAPMLGGVTLWLREAPTHQGSSPDPEASRDPDAGPDAHRGEDLLRPGPASAERKTCPACGERLRADRTFCPDCGHDFDEDVDDQATTSSRRGT